MIVLLMNSATVISLLLLIYFYNLQELDIVKLLLWEIFPR